MKQAFIGGACGVLFLLAIAGLLYTIGGALVGHGRFLAAQECIKDSADDAEAKRCLKRWMDNR